MSFLEIVFVGQCEVFVCLDFGNLFCFCFVFSLGCEAQVRERGASSLKKNVDFFQHTSP